MKPTPTLRIILVLSMLAMLGPGCSGCGSSDEETTTPRDPGPGEVKIVETATIDALRAPEGEQLPELDEPISPVDTQKLVEDFSWSEAVTLEESDEEGRAAIHYVKVYVHDRDEMETLDALALMHSPLPLFHSEKAARWGGKSGVFSFHGDRDGVFVFALMGGAVYNDLRQKAIDGTVAFEVILPQEVPADIGADSTGAIPYKALAESGLMRSIVGPIDESGSSDPNGEGLTVRRQALVPEFIRSSANLAVDTIDEFRRGAIEFIRFWEGTARFLIHVEVENIDPTFRHRDQLEMWSTWRNAPIKLQGFKLRMQDDAVLSDAYLNEHGEALINTSQNVGLHICIEARNQAIYLSEHVTPLIICNFGEGGIFPETGGKVSSGDGEVRRLNFPVRDYRTNIMAQFTDSHAFVRDRFGMNLRPAYVLIGPFADIIGEINAQGALVGRAVAFCSGTQSPLRGLLESTLISVGALASVLSSVVLGIPGLEILGLGFTAFAVTVLAQDVVFPDASNAMGTMISQSPVSRGVPTHEYGHFAMCEMLRRTNPAVFSTAWGDVILTMLTEGQGPDKQQLYWSEAFADFFSYNVTGGVNYFNLGSGDVGFSSRRVFFCNKDRSNPAACMEDNVGGPGQIASNADIDNDPFDYSAALMATLLHDVFDGNRSETAISTESGWYAPMSGVSPYLSAPRLPFSSVDETIALSGADLREFFRIWARDNATFFDRGIYDALARLMKRRDYSDEAICELFALHQPEGQCRDMISAEFLDLDSIRPRRPSFLRYERELSNTVTMLWNDSSLEADRFVWQLDGQDGHSLSGELDWTREASVEMPERLHADVRYTFEVFTRNGDLDGPPNSVEFVTYPGAIEDLRAEPRPAGGQLTWRSEGASDFLIEIAEHDEEAGRPGPYRDLASTPETSYQLRGLDGGKDYYLRVTPLNQNGERGATENAILTAGDSSLIYVSASGDDNASGSMRSPLKTIAAAIEATASEPAAEIRLLDGPFVETEPLEIRNDIIIRPETAPSSGYYRIDLQGFVDSTQACYGVSLNPTKRLGRTPILVHPGAALTMEHVGLRVDYTGDSSATRCRAAIISHGDLLTLNSSRNVWVTNPLAGADCAVPLQVTDGDLTLTDSVMAMGVDSMDTRPNAEMGAACVKGADNVTLTDTSLRADYNTRVNPSDAGPGRIAGLVAREIDRLRSTRSRITARFLPDSDGDGRGRYYGAEVSARSQVYLDNTILQTSRGGSNENIGLSLSSYDNATGVNLWLYFTTIQVGDDFELIGDPGDNLYSSALRATGLNDLHMVNNLIVNASGGDMTTVSRNIIDLRSSGELPCGLRFEGNVLGNPDSNRLGGKALIWGNGEFDSTTTQANINSFARSACRGSAVVADNYVQHVTPATTADQAAWVCHMEEDGEPSPYRFFGRTQGLSYELVREQGVPLERIPAALRNDVRLGYRSATTRPTGAPLQCGAWDIASRR